MHYDSVSIDIIIMIFMALSAMHFGVIFAIFAQRSLKPLGSSVTRYYFAIIAALALMITGSLMTSGGYSSFADALLDSSFQTISFLTTTGFGQSDTAAWPMMAGALLMFAAIHCGCSGSTTGGIKADRALIAGKAVAGEFRRKLSPSSVFRIKLGKTFIPEDTVSAVFLFIVLYIIVIFASFVAVMLCGVEISEAFSGTVASLGNVGPGIGSLGTMGNYAAQPEAAKFIYTVDMLLGRIEIFPILIIISMMFNRKQS
jgi:trk system potassium uptake protein TrkH